MTKKYCIVYYSSDLSPDRFNSYCFWYSGNMIRIIGDKPFSRWDVAEILSVDIDQASGPYIINLRILGDPEVDKFSDEDNAELPTTEIPTLVFAKTKIYTSEYSNYEISAAENAEILFSFGNVFDGNKGYAVAALVRGDLARIYGIDSITGQKMEWLIADYFKRA